MNPLTQTLNQLKMNERELEMGLAGTSKSWHQEYKDSAWVFLGGLPYEMTEGDVICMFSQYGEPVIEFSVALNSIRIKGFSGGAESLSSLWQIIYAAFICFWIVVGSLVI